MDEAYNLAEDFGKDTRAGGINDGVNCFIGCFENFHLTTWEKKRREVASLDSIRVSESCRKLLFKFTVFPVSTAPRCSEAPRRLKFRLLTFTTRRLNVETCRLI